MRRNGIKIIGNILAIIAALYLIDFFKNLDIQFQMFMQKDILFIVLAGCIISLCALMIEAFAWKRTIEIFSESKVSYQSAAKVYLQANIGKYIPGNIVHFVERNMFAVKEGIRQTEAFMATFLEIAGQLIAAIILGIILSFQNVCRVIRILFSPEYVFILFILCLISTLAFYLLYKKSVKLHFIYKKIKQPVFWKGFCLNIIIYMCFLVLLAGLMCMVVGTFNHQLLFSDVIKIMNVYILAWTAGFVVPGAPSGIGVREFVITYLTKNYQIQKTILLAMMVHRIITILGDILGYIWAKRIK